MGTAKVKGPGVQTGAGNYDAAGIRNSVVSNTIIAAQAQFFTASQQVQPELAIILTSAVFGGSHG